MLLPSWTRHPLNHAELGRKLVQAAWTNVEILRESQRRPLLFQHFLQFNETQSITAIAKPFEAKLLRGCTITLIFANPLGQHLWPSPGPGLHSKCSKSVSHMLMFSVYTLSAREKQAIETKYTRIWPFINEYDSIGQRLENMFSLHNFYTMVIEQLTDLRKVNTENLKIRTYFWDQVWVADCSKNLKIKIVQSMQVSIWLSNLTFHLQLFSWQCFGCKIWLQSIQNQGMIRPEIVCKLLRTAI